MIGARFFEVEPLEIKCSGGRFDRYAAGNKNHTGLRAFERHAPEHVRFSAIHLSNLVHFLQSGFVTHLCQYLVRESGRCALNVLKQVMFHILGIDIASSDLNG